MLICFQLHITEMREFCRPLGDDGAPTLIQMLDWFSGRCTVVIALERMGAVARLRASEEILVAWPYGLRNGELRDTTGAGDAFGAGMVACLLDHPLATVEELRDALRNGSLFAAYACTTTGGAENCPTAAELDAFAKRHEFLQEMQVTSGREARRILNLIDQVFSD